MNPYIIPCNKFHLWIKNLLNVKVRPFMYKNTGMPFSSLYRKQFLKQDPNIHKGGKAINLAILKFRNKYKKTL